ncbi:hypothetical protein CYMTET_38592 [Cymbomonas tetramitiformis]|uniref:Uncharacterized protein n=1 Tax=Cymbomonas tetramitiformis TaxID=36881 RepID=A0AAE0F5B6_9CHLO|nr:hypothetical protein CYMTET_38592 [Cymbomonas tetramitiformis]
MADPKSPVFLKHDASPTACCLGAGKPVVSTATRRRAEAPEFTVRASGVMRCSPQPAASDRNLRRDAPGAIGGM